MHLDGQVLCVVGHQANDVLGATGEVQLLDRELAVQVTDGDAPVAGFAALIDHQDVVGMNTGIDHAVAHHAAIVCGGRVLDQHFIEVHGRLHIVLCRRGEAGPHTAIHIRQRHVGREIAIDKFDFVHRVFGRKQILNNK